MQIESVKCTNTEQSFLSVPDKIYRTDNKWVKPLLQEEKDVFDTDRNSFFKKGIAQRWVLKKEDKVIGRIAAFISDKEATTFRGGIGFFECIDNQEAAFQLFDVAKKWLQKEGAISMDGPISFGENDNNWGLLIKGFTTPGYGMSYNPLYYQKFFEAYGFQPLYEQYTNHFDILKGLPERFRKIAKRVISNPTYSFCHFEKKNSEKYLRDLELVYNLAWQQQDDFKPINFDYLLSSFEKMKSFLQEKLIWFAYADDKPIGFIVSIPDINQILKSFDGNLNLWNKLKFLFQVKMKKINRVRVLVMGVIPEYQNRGIESGLIEVSFNAAKKLQQFEEAELSWVGSFNDKMMAIHKASGAVLGKVHITYRYQF